MAGYEPVKTPYFAAPRRWEAIDRMFRELFALGGAAVLTLTATEIVAGATGEVTRLQSTVPGATFSKVSGPANLAISPAGVISLTAGLPLNGTVTFVARVEGDNGSATERRFTLTASITDVPAPTVFNTDETSDLEESAVAGAMALFAEMNQINDAEAYEISALETRIAAQEN